MRSRSPSILPARRSAETAEGCLSRPGRLPAGQGRASKGRGFTLLETLLALTVLSIGLAVILQGLALGLQVRRESSDFLRMSLLAANELDRFLADEEGRELPSEGEEEGYRWRFERGDPSPADGDYSEGLSKVLLTVESGRGRTWEIVTLIPAEERGQ